MSEQTSRKSRVLVTEDRGFVVAVGIEPDACLADFVIWEVNGSTLDEVYLIDKECAYLSSESPPYCRGFVKWDGCANFGFQNGNMMLHVCGLDEGPSSFDSIVKAFRLAYTECAELLKAEGHWDDY